jgi:hypothetical protein
MTAILQGMPFVFADELLKNLRRAARLTPLVGRRCRNNKMMSK